MATAPCDDCGKRVEVPEDWPVDYAYCDECRARDRAFAAQEARETP